MRRAAHQVLDRPLVFDDPLALAILGRSPEDVSTVRGETARMSRHRRAFINARSRYVEDELARLVAHGVDQYVVLGAGLDTFAYRNPHPRLRVFEVDHPATQAWKRGRLAAANIPLPASLDFVPVDFEHERVSDALAHGGFDAGRPAFFGWLGVVAYLELAAITRTLEFVASCASGTAIVFDYSIPPDRLPPRQRARFETISSRAAAVGEPWRTFFEPHEAAALLRSAGFAAIEDVDADALNARYFSGRRDGLRVDGVGRLAHLVCGKR